MGRILTIEKDLGRRLRTKRMAAISASGGNDHNAVILPTKMVRPPAPSPSRPSKGTHERLQQRGKNARNQPAVKCTAVVTRSTSTTTFVKRQYRR